MTKSPRVVTAQPPKRVRRPDWPAIKRVVVGKDREPLTAMERAQAAKRVLAERKTGKAG